MRSSANLILVVSIQTTILFLLLSPDRACSVTVDEVTSLVGEQALKVETLEGWVKHEIRAKDEAQQLMGKFYYKAPDKLKIHYVSPEEVFILSIQESLWTYTPSTNEVNVVGPSGDDFAVSQREGYVQFILDPITPLLPDYSFSFLWKGPVESYDEVWVLQGGPKASQSSISRLLFWVDARMGKVLRAEVYNTKGALVLIALLDDFGEIEPRLWMPGHYSVSVATSKGDLEMETWLSRLKVNQPIRETVFEFGVPEGARIITKERR